MCGPLAFSVVDGSHRITAIEELSARRVKVDIELKAEDAVGHHVAGPGLHAVRVAEVDDVRRRRHIE